MCFWESLTGYFLEKIGGTELIKPKSKSYFFFLIKDRTKMMITITTTIPTIQ